MSRTCRCFKCRACQGTFSDADRPIKSPGIVPHSEASVFEQTLTPSLPDIYTYQMLPRVRPTPSQGRRVQLFQPVPLAFPLLLCLLFPPLLLSPPPLSPLLLFLLSPLLLFPLLFLLLLPPSRCLPFLPRPFPLPSLLRLFLPLLSLLLLFLSLLLSLRRFPVPLLSLVCRLLPLRPSRPLLPPPLLLPLLLFGRLEQCIMLHRLSPKMLRCRLDQIFRQMFGTTEVHRLS